MFFYLLINVEGFDIWMLFYCFFRAFEHQYSIITHCRWLFIHSHIRKKQIPYDERVKHVNFSIAIKYYIWLVLSTMNALRVDEQINKLFFAPFFSLCLLLVLSQVNWKSFLVIFSFNIRRFFIYFYFHPMCCKLRLVASTILLWFFFHLICLNWMKSVFFLHYSLSMLKFSFLSSVFISS